ncbi:MAG TPA: glycoside hydrolase family 2 TIM barrel-domain containing protein [Candidatus Kapabacteria bacterium]|nr:glycoside hydrolase family 2 TIM barrel-domain containing protein [Candidatus Kapabacteria bacterium]
MNAADRWPVKGNWLAINASNVTEEGSAITLPGYNLTGWMPAVVPGTVLTTLVANGVYLDPYYSTNISRIPDASKAGVDFYTYWFYTSFTLGDASPGSRIWLEFRGINYRANVFFNGTQLNAATLEGMFQRYLFDITDLVNPGSDNALAVWTQPPDPPGVPGGNGGQDPNIGNNVTMRYTVGWDWVEPIPDRSTGIWDAVTIAVTGPVRIANPHVVTTVPGVRLPQGTQDPAQIALSVEVTNASDVQQSGALMYTFNGVQFAQYLILEPGEMTTVTFEEQTIENPELWWPIGTGAQPLLPLDIQFSVKGYGISDTAHVDVGIRTITSWIDTTTGGKVIAVNGQQVFIRGANWIGTDAMLRYTTDSKRYRDEVRMHAEMNVNMIRVWGGGIAERPEFYDACDRYGILVMQDFWISGEFTGPFPAGWSETFLSCARDTIKLLRNHPSLCFWSGGNETAPPSDIDTCLRCYITGLQQDGSPCTSGENSACGSAGVLDGTRSYVSYSTSDGLGPGDGPYGILQPASFFNMKSCTFNPEVGSVGTPVYESLKLFLPPAALVDFPRDQTWNTTWAFHKYIPYSNPQQGQQVPCLYQYPPPVYDQIAAYGQPENTAGFALRAQIVNYVQYQALFEGFGSNMWQWYTGVMVWKSQNPWPGLRGSFYDWYLAQNGGLYGTKHANEPVHILLTQETQKVMAINTTPISFQNLTAEATIYDLQGTGYDAGTQLIDLPANAAVPLFPLVVPSSIDGAYFVQLELVDESNGTISETIYWQTTTADFTGLAALAPVTLGASAVGWCDGATWHIAVTLENPAQTSGGTIAFFLQLQTIDPTSGSRVLPSFYSDNCFTMLPGTTRTIAVDFSVLDVQPATFPQLWIEGWNVSLAQIAVTWQAT